jgi:hypothetical protein
MLETPSANYRIQKSRNPKGVQKRTKQNRIRNKKL